MIDIVISVQYEREANTLSYDLDVRNPRLGLRAEKYAKQVISRNVISVLDALLGSIEGVALEFDRENGERRLEAARRFEGMGLHLFEELIPGKLQGRLSSLASECEQYPVGTLQIRSNETFIPWELLRISSKNPKFLGVFLVEAFCLARTLFGFKPVTQLPFRDIALVVPSESSLPRAGDEKKLVLSLNGKTRRVTEVEAGYGKVTDAFSRRQFDGWHFTGHGVKNTESSNLQSLVLDSGELSSFDLHPSRGSGATRPLVFANACYSGRGGHGLRRTGGLARAFLNADVGAYIGSHWTISDAPAHDFAQEFYRSFCSVGLPIAEAVRCARLVVRDRYPGDPTWLAYSVFAHPQAECGLPSEMGAAPSSAHGSWHVERGSKQIDNPFTPAVQRSPAVGPRQFPMGWLAMVPTLLIVLGLVGSRSWEPALTRAPVNYLDFGPPAMETEVQEAELDEVETPGPVESVRDLLQTSSEGVCVRVRSEELYGAQVDPLMSEALEHRGYLLVADSPRCRWRLEVWPHAGSREEPVYGTLVIRNFARLSVDVIESGTDRIVARKMSLMQFNDVQDKEMGRAEALRDAVRAWFESRPDVMFALREQVGGG